MPAQHQITTMYNIAGMLKIVIRHISVGPSNRQNEIDKWPIAGYQVAANFFEHKIVERQKVIAIAILPVVPWEPIKTGTCHVFVVVLLLYCIFLFCRLAIWPAFYHLLKKVIAYPDILEQSVRVMFGLPISLQMVRNGCVVLLNVLLCFEQSKVQSLKIHANGYDGG